LRADFQMKHQAETGVSQARLDRAVTRYRDRLAATEYVDRRDAPKRSRQIVAIAKNTMIAAYCLECGWVTVFRQWPARLRRLEGSWRERGCAKCNKGPIGRIPPEGSTHSIEQLISEARAFADRERLEPPAFDAFILALRHGVNNLGVRDAVIAPELASPHDVARSKDARIRKSKRKQRSVHNQVKKIRSNRRALRRHRP
jgi:hypothetical protein